MNDFPNGSLLAAIIVSNTKAQAATTLAQIKQYGLKRPTEIDKKPTKTDDKSTIEAHEIHEQTQRNFDKARKDRAIRYATYIKSVEIDGAMGGTPAITIYFPDELKEVNGGLLIPYDAVLTAIDGETQTEARYLLAESYPDSINTPIAITIYHGIKLEHAKQILHDVNHYVTPVSELKASTFNNNGAISKAVKSSLMLSGMDISNVNEKGAVANKKTALSHLQLMTFIAACQLGETCASKGISATIMSDLNSPIGHDVGENCLQSAVDLIKMALIDPKIGKYNKALWQIAGVLCASGRDVKSINWEAAGIAYTNLPKKTTQGGKVLPMSEKLTLIRNAF